MPTSLEALQVILYLLPGYVTLRVKELLSFPNKASDIGRAIDGVVLTFLNLVVLFTLRLILPENFFSTIYATTISLFLISVLLGVVLGSDTVTSKCYGAMRYLGLTNMSGRVDAWSDPHSTSKCNTCGFEGFRWCFESEAFPRPVIEPALNR